MSARTLALADHSVNLIDDLLADIADKSRTEACACSSYRSAPPRASDRPSGRRTWQRRRSRREGAAAEAGADQSRYADTDKVADVEMVGLAKACALEADTPTGR